MNTVWMNTIVFLALLVASPAWATETTITGIRIQLSAAAEADFANNEMVIHFRIESEGKNPTTLRRKVNAISHAVDENIKGMKGIRSQKTMNRQLQARWQYNKLTKQQVRYGWLLRQNEQIICDIKAGAAIVTAIEQAGALLGNIRFQIDALTQQHHRQTLEQQAIKDFRARASYLAQGFDAHSFQIINIQTEQQQRRLHQPRVEQRMFKSAVANDAPPVLHSGEQSIKVSVRGTILLPPKDFVVTP